VPCNLTDVLITFADLAPSQTDKLEQNGVEVFGSANLVFFADDIYGHGFGIAGGVGDFLIDDLEFVTFRFASPVQNARYFVELTTTGSDAIYGESEIEAFDATGASLGTQTATDLDQKNVSLLFDDAPISEFTITLNDGDGIQIGNVRYSICMSP